MYHPLTAFKKVFLKFLIFLFLKNKKYHFNIILKKIKKQMLPNTV